MGGLASPEKERIAINIEGKLERLSLLIKKQPSNSTLSVKNERRLTQLLTIFGKGDLSLPILLGSSSEEPNFMENSLRGLIYVMLKDDPGKG